MRAISAKKCITEGKLELQRLFEYVENHATGFKVYEMVLTSINYSNKEIVSIMANINTLDL